MEITKIVNHSKGNIDDDDDDDTNVKLLLLVIKHAKYEIQIRCYVIRVFLSIINQLRKS
jgi:hypothetical protein